MIARAGHRATQVGPLVAADADAAVHAARRRRWRAPPAACFIDVPVRAEAVTARWRSAASRASVRTSRMALGARPAAQPHLSLFALAGPEFG